MEDYIAPWLEWEVLREPITIPNVDDAEELPEGKKKIVINRDEHYNLQSVLSMKGAYDLFKKESKNTVPGSFIDFFEISGSNKLWETQYTLESCYIARTHISQGADEEPLCETNLGVQGLKVKHKMESEGESLTEWYINGPRDNFVFRNLTERKILSKIFRERSVLRGEKIHSIEVSRGDTKSISFDFLRIRAGDLQFLITKVPVGLGPDWSSNIGIEYRKGWGGIPSSEDREKISELCSFICGRQLLLVGYTIYDKDYMLVEEYACNPWGGHPESLCSQPDHPPIRINMASSQGKAEDLISQLLPKYFELRDSYHLKDALWLYWITREMAAGTNLPLLAAAVEAIMNGWFNSTQTRSHGVYMEKAHFDSLLRDEMTAIKEKLEAEMYRDKVIKRLQDAYQMGVTDRFQFFFEEIVLAVNGNEWEAINARHDIAHGRLATKDKAWEMVQNTNAYETLLNKIILKLLGYSGDYINRSSISWRDEQLDWK